MTIAGTLLSLLCVLAWLAADTSGNLTFPLIFVLAGFVTSLWANGWLVMMVKNISTTKQIGAFIGFAMLIAVLFNTLALLL